MSAVLTVEGVTVRFAGLVALSDVSLVVGGGTIEAVIGPNGAGKSTLFGTISGYVRPTAGRVAFDGTDMTRATPTEAARAGMRRTFQNGGIFPDLSVLENVLTGLPGSWRFGMLGVALGFAGARQRERSDVAAARALLEKMGIGGLAGRRAGDLPAGQQRLVEISRALAGEAKLLLLDEPAVGLTRAELDTLGGVLRRLAAGGLAILLVEHVIDFVMALAQRVLVLNHGEVLAQGTPAEIRAHDAVLEAYLGRR
ncbi:MAG: ABC transporter ATP-binding protein [Acetobacteraceae bacterium]